MSLDKFITQILNIKEEDLEEITPIMQSGRCYSPTTVNVPAKPQLVYRVDHSLCYNPRFCGYDNCILASHLG